MILLQYFTSYALMGLIWTIQLVHYPAFRHVAVEDFHNFHHMHTRGISVIVMPLMLVELAAACWLVWNPATRDPLQWLLLTLVGLIWLSTFSLQVPCHAHLAQGKDLEKIEKLISTNWLRTLAWTLKAGLLLWQQWTV